MLPLSDGIPARRFPFVNVAIIVANFAVWLFYELPHLDSCGLPRVVLSVHRQRLLPWPRAVGISWITSMFLHGSWDHILGNMLFLAVFGKNVEDAFGHLRYLVFYFAGGFVATMAQTFITLAFGNGADARVPNLGASGAIAAVLGAYFVLYPEQQRLRAGRRLPRADLGLVLPRLLVPLPAVRGELRPLRRRCARRRRRLLRPRRRLRLRRPGDTAATEAVLAPAGPGGVPLRRPDLTGMHTATILVGLGAFLACAVEMVEALTIVLGVGTVRGWRSTLIGVGAAAVVLAVLIAALGPALQQIPIDDLRLLVGGLLLVFGLQWLRKAILRSQRLQAAARRGRGIPARAGRGRGGRRRAAGRARLVLLYRLLQGRPARRTGGRLHRDQLRKRARPTRRRDRGRGRGARGGRRGRRRSRAARSRGFRRTRSSSRSALLLTSFGCFWGAEGAGAEWPGDELSLLALVAFLGGFSWLAVRALSRRRHELRPAEASA